jgi:Ca2+-binding RTX toxin-like protein
MGRRGQALGAVAAAIFAAGLGAATAHGAVSCTMGAGGVVSVTMTAHGDALTVSRSGSSVLFNGAACGASTVTSVSRVDVAGAEGRQLVVIDLAGGALQPGLGSEADGTPEIEFAVDLRGGTDRFEIRGSGAADSLTLGSAGATMTTDDDRDVTLAGVETLQLDGGGGNDVLRASGGFGTGGAAQSGVWLSGGAGNDALVGGAEQDMLVGGEGADTLDGGAGTDHLFGEDGNDVLAGGGGNDWLFPGPGTDRVDGGPGNDSIPMGDAPNGADSVYGGAGRDRVSYENRAARVVASLDGVAGDGAAGEGDNLRRDVEVLVGGAGDDVLRGNAAGNTLNGLAGNDELYGDAGADDLYGAGGNDRLFGEGDADTLYGEAGNDHLEGGEANDGLVGGPGSDTLRGGEDDDTLHEEGDLTGTDDLGGGAGRDRAYFTFRSARVVVDLDNVADDGGAGENDNVRTDVEDLWGTELDDVLVGSGKPNAFYGHGGNDTLNTGGGEDQLHGGAGNDILTGGSGHDQMYGSDGSDSLRARDGGDDYVDGGPGTDSGEFDSFDTVVDVP